MAKIMIVGTGRVGLATAKIIRYIGDHDVVLVDSDETRFDEAHGELLTTPSHYTAGDILRWQVASTADFKLGMEAHRPAVVVCSTPFSINTMVAQAAHQVGCHYIDFTEDNGVTQEIAKLDVRDVTFVPQTGLAPGLVSYLGLDLFKNLGTPASLDLRVGALPQVAFGPGHYAITWSPEGLINEYLKPALRLRNHLEEEVQPLQELETVMVDGRLYEGFTTSGGVGNLCAYTDIPNVEYKTLRYPGHLDFLRVELAKVYYNFSAAVNYAQRIFNTTRQDVVVLLAHAVDQDGKAASTGLHFYPHQKLGLTALELTTAGTGVAVVELLMADRLPTGVLLPDQVPLSELKRTLSYELVMASAR